MTDILNYIRRSFSNHRFDYSEHAYLRSLERDISFDEIIEIVENCIIIENYPYDKYLPTCLILGFTKYNRPLHIQVTTDTSTVMKIVTLYQPEEDKWINNFKERK